MLWDGMVWSGLVLVRSIGMGWYRVVRHRVWYGVVWYGIEWHVRLVGSRLSISHIRHFQYIHAHCFLSPRSELITLVYGCFEVSGFVWCLVREVRSEVSLSLRSRCGRIRKKRRRGVRYGYLG